MFTRIEFVKFAEFIKLYSARFTGFQILYRFVVLECRKVFMKKYFYNSQSTCRGLALSWNFFLVELLTKYECAKGRRKSNVLEFL